MTTPSPSPELQAVLRRLDELAAVDPRLDEYRTSPEPGALSDVPANWYVSDDMAWLKTHHAWWPGRFSEFRHDTNIVSGMALWGIDDGRPPGAKWFSVGAVWERDSVYTPLLEWPQPTAPLFMFSSQALWHGMPFPTEAALLESFVITIEECGYGEEPPGVDPFFPEWVTGDPLGDPTTGQIEASIRIQEQTSEWKTGHPLWLKDRMPFLIDGPIPEDLIAHILDVEVSRVRTEAPPRPKPKLNQPEEVVEAAVELAMRFAQAMNTGDWDDALACLAPDLQEHGTGWLITTWQNEVLPLYGGTIDSMERSDQFTLHDWPEREMADVAWIPVILVKGKIRDGLYLHTRIIGNKVYIQHVDWTTGLRRPEGYFANDPAHKPDT